MLASDCTASVVHGAGGASAPTIPFDMVTPRASAPALTAIAPGSASVAVDPEPDAELCAPNACVLTPSTPLHAEISNPPSITDCDRSARTARMLSWAGLLYPSGKPCTFVATYVAIEMPPDVTYSTSVYVLPTRGYPGNVSTSVTESMMLVEPSQKKVATIASPWWGLVLLNPLIKRLPLSLSVPFS